MAWFKRSKSPAPNSLEVCFVRSSGETFSAGVEPGTNLLMASARGPEIIDSGCAAGNCGTCEVDILHGAWALSPVSANEQATMERLAMDAGHRLGCQAKVKGSGIRVRLLATREP